MPIELDILDAQQKLRQLGEIRIGHTVAMKGKDKNGNPKRRPEKLDKFRFTSPSKPLLEKVAALYGGTVQPWTPQNGGPAEWQLYSNTNLLPVLVPTRPDSQWFEHYEGNRCMRKCTGRVEKISRGKCICDPDGELTFFDDRLCKPTTRLNVMLRDLAAIGHWLLTSKGRNAALELPVMARFLANADGYVPARLGMEARVSYPSDPNTPPFRFMVPHLEVDLAPVELLAGRSGMEQILASHKAAAAIENGRKAIEAAPATATIPDPGIEYFRSRLSVTATEEELTTLLLEAQSHGHARSGDALFKEFLSRRAELTEVTDAEIVDDPNDIDDLLQRIAENVPDGWGPEQIAADFAHRHDGLFPLSASADQLRDYLAWNQAGRPS